MKNCFFARENISRMNIALIYILYVLCTLQYYTYNVYTIYNYKGTLVEVPI